MGQKGKIRVTFSNPVATATDVMLTSGSTATATVPDHLTVPAGAVSADAPYTGVAPGSVVFRATSAGDTQITTTAVVDVLRVSVPSGPTFEVGAHGILSQNVNILVPEALALSLASSQDSTATVDSTVTIPPFSSTGVAQITAVSPGTSVITVSYNGQQATQNVTVIDKARIAQAYGPNLLEVGGHDTVQIWLTAQLAKATDIAVTSSDPSVISIAPSYTLAAGSDYAYVDLQVVAPGSTNLQFSLNGSVETMPIAVVSKAQLESVNLTGIPSVGYSSQLTVFMDVVAATAHDVTLTSSDPNVVAVPSKVTVFAGMFSASAPVTPASTGDAAVARVVEHYARTTPKVALGDIIREGIFRCNSRRVARLVAARGVPVYLYEWTHTLDGPPFAHALGPTHGVDLFFVFGTTSSEVGPSAAEQPLVELVQDLWGHFALTGDPGHGWQRYTKARDEHFVLDLQPSTGAQLDRAACDFWDSLSAW